MGWYGVKEWIEATSGLDMDALHVHAGLLLQLVAAWLLRRPVKSLWPWLLVLAATLLNEAYDLTVDPWPEAERHSQWVESLKDLLNTMAMPSLLLLLARFAPGILIGRPPQPPSSGARGA